MSVSNPYKVLQVDPEAEDEVIEAAYRRLARKYHPDVSTGPDAQDRMVQINQAWEMLRDPIRRAAVDRARARTAATAARATAAEAQADIRSAASAARDQPRYRSTSADAGGPAGAPPGTTGGHGPGWPFPGMQGTDTGSADRMDHIPSGWSAGRSMEGGGYDPHTMGTAQGHGSAGPPPGNPSGSVLAFGRFAGWSLGEIARTDLEYLEWLDRMPIGRTYQFEIDGLLRSSGRRTTAPAANSQRRGLFRRR
jgi:curved DNA-binding protein CbpA